MTSPIDDEPRPPSGNATNLPGLGAPELNVAYLAKIKEILEVLLGRRGSSASKWDRAVTFRDLYGEGQILNEGNRPRLGGGGNGDPTDGMSPIVYRGFVNNIDAAIRKTAAYKSLLTRIGSAEDLTGFPDEIRSLLSQSLDKLARERQAYIGVTEKLIQDQVQSFASRVEDVTAAFGDNVAAVRSVAAAYADESKSVAVAVTTLVARINDVDGDDTGVTIEEKFLAQADINTGLLGQWTVKIQAGSAENPVIAGVALSLEGSEATGLTSAFVILADKFALYTSGGDFTPFSVDETGVIINGSLRVNGDGLTLEELSAGVKLIRLSATSQVFQVPKTGSPTPSTITFTAYATNLTGSPVFTLTQSGGAVSTISGAGDTRSIAYADLTGDRAIITVTQDGETDQITVVKVREGSDAITGFMTNEDHTIATASDGTGGDYSTATTTMKVYIGATDDTANWTFARVNGTGVTSSLSTNVLTVTALSVDNSYVDVTASRTGYSSIVKRFTIGKAKAGAAGAGTATALVYAYQRSASTLTSNPGAVTYTFASASITTPATDALSNGWTKTIPAGSNPLWVTVATASGTGATDTIASGEWSAPVQLVADGAPGATGAAGLNSATVFIYQRTTTTSAPTLPSATATYTFATGATTGLNNGWTTSVPDPAGGSYLHVSTATAANTTATDTIASGEWAAAKLMAQDGAAAPLLTLTSTGQAITYNGAGVETPASQTLSFTAVLQNATGTATFVCTLYNAAGGSLGTVTMGGGASNTRTLTGAQFTTSAAYAVITATLGALSDTNTVVRLQDGAGGLNGFLTNEAHTVPASSAGVVSSYTGASGNFKVFLGTTDVTANCTFQVVGFPLVATSSPTAATGAFSVTSSSGSGGNWADASSTTTVTYRATYTPTGSNLDKIFTITKSVAGAQGAQGNVGSTGNTGTRGTVNISESGHGSWSDANAAAAIATAGYGTPIARDIVTLYNSSFSETRYYTGSSWLVLTAYINGNLLVSGTISAAAIMADTLTGQAYRTVAGTGARITINESSNNKLQVYNSSNVLIAELGGTSGVLYIPVSPSLSPGVQVVSAASSAAVPAVYGSNTSSGIGVQGLSSSGIGIEAFSTSGTALKVSTSSGTAIQITGGTTGISQTGGGDNFLRHLNPATDGSYSLGTSGSYRWSALYANSATITTSDQRTKTDIQNVDLGLDFINALRPVKYKQIVAENIVTDVPVEVERDPELDPGIFIAPATTQVITPRPGTRFHYGLIAQEVKAALTSAGVADAAFWSLSDPENPDSQQALRYEEMVAPLIRAVQQLSARVVALEQLVNP